MKHGQELGFDDDGRPVLITRAAEPYEEQHRARVRKYLTILWHNGLISLAILIASIPLPWIAVLIANDRPPRKAEEPRRYESARRIPLFPTAERPALPQRSASTPQPDGGARTGDVPS
jgi:hypothetical protein